MDLIDIGAIALLAAAMAGAALAAYRHETRQEADDAATTGGIDHLLAPDDAEQVVPVEHEGATEEWSPADGYGSAFGHPLERELSAIELADALTFEEIAAAYPVRLDWQPPSFTQEWSTLGAVLAEMGETQPLPRIEVPA